MGKYIFRVPVEGFEYYVVEAENREAAWNLLNVDIEIPETPIDTEVSFDGDFEFVEVLEPSEED